MQDVYQTDLFEGHGKENLLQGITNYGIPIAYHNVEESWKNVIESLRFHSINFDYIPHYEFLTLCDKKFISSNQVNELIEYLNNLGHVIYYPNNPNLKDWIILNCNWVVKTIYRILESKRVKDNFGEFSQNDLEEILYQREYENKLGFIMGLMEKYLLSCRISDGEWLAPQLLRVETPDLESWEKSNKKSLIANYDFLPKGFIGQLLVNIKSKINIVDAWVSGVIFDYNGTRCLVRELWSERKIEIKAKNENDVIAFCYSNLKDLSKIHGVEFDLGLPCNCDRCSDSKMPFLHSYERLLARYRSKVLTVECRESGEKIEVHHLLNNYFNENLEKVESPLKIFISYSKHDGNQKDTLIKHLSGLRGKVVTWHDRDILPGEDWDERIKAELHGADVVLYLVTHNSLATEYIQNVELSIIEKRCTAGECILVPIIVDFCFWTDLEFSKRNALPEKGIPVTDAYWKNENQAWMRIVEGIKRLHEDFFSKQNE